MNKVIKYPSGYSLTPFESILQADAFGRMYCDGPCTVLIRFAPARVTVARVVGR